MPERSSPPSVWRVAAPLLPARLVDHLVGEEQTALLKAQGLPETYESALVITSFYGGVWACFGTVHEPLQIGWSRYQA